MRSHIGAIATVTAALLVMSMPARAADDWVTKQSARSVADTVSALTAAVDKAGAKVMATVDHQANAATIDTGIPATTLVIFGNPKLGTPLIAENRRVAIDLPQKVLVWDEDGVTMLGYVDPAELAERVRPVFESLSRPTIVTAHGGVSRCILRMYGGFDDRAAARGDIAQDRILHWLDGGLTWV